MQIWAESGKSALPICNYSQILYQFLTFTQNLKRSPFRLHQFRFYLGEQSRVPLADSYGDSIVALFLKFIIPDVLVKVFLFKKSISGMTNKPPMRKSFILCNCRS